MSQLEKIEMRHHSLEDKTEALLVCKLYEEDRTKVVRSPALRQQHNVECDSMRWRCTDP